MHADRDGRGRDQMESIMLTRSQDIRRRLDGSIDIDFYRQKALMERRAYMTRFFSGARKLGSLLPICIDRGVPVASNSSSFASLRQFISSGSVRI
jgi:hypothetical protein